MSEMLDSRQDRRARRRRQAGPAARRAGRAKPRAAAIALRTVDFTRPTKFTRRPAAPAQARDRDLLPDRRTRLSAELRVPVELEVINTTQLTWSAAQQQLPANSLSVLLDVNPIGTRMLLTAEQSFVLAGLEPLLGGSPERSRKGRRLTEIDWSLTRRLFESLVHQLSLVWHELAAIELSAGEIDPHTTPARWRRLASRPSVLDRVPDGQASSPMALLIPWVAIEPIDGRVSGRDTSRRRRGAERRRRCRRPLSDVPVTLRAEVASVDLPLDRDPGLAPGSLSSSESPPRTGSRSSPRTSSWPARSRATRASPAPSRSADRRSQSR